MSRSSLATWLPCNNFWSGGNSKRFVVIHGTASGAPQTAYQLATSGEFNNGTGASVHYIVDKGVIGGESSQVYQIVDEDDSAWGNCCCTGPACPPGTLPAPGAGRCHDPWVDDSLGCGHNWNFDTISIENIKYADDNSDTLTPSQWSALVELVRDICIRNGIPMVKATSYNSGGIIGHYDLDPVNRARCPGTFDWGAFIQEINMGVPAGWSDDGTALHNPANGFVVTQGFRNYILNHAWDGGNVPLQNVVAANPVEESNPGLGGGTVQVFRFDRLEWTATIGVIRGWIGQELLFVEKEKDGLVLSLIDDASTITAQAATIAQLNSALAACISGGIAPALQSLINSAEADLTGVSLEAKDVADRAAAMATALQPYVK